MTLILAGQIGPLQKEIAELQSKLQKAQKKLYEINEKVRKAEEPVSKIKSLAKDLTKMFENDPGILAEIKEHILNAFNGQYDTSVEKQEDSPVVNTKIDEEVVTKDVVEDTQQALPEATKDIADDDLVVEKQVEDGKDLDEASNIEDAPVKKKRSRKSKNTLENVIDQENEINNIVSEIINDVKFTNLSQIEYFFKEIEKKHGVKKGRLIRGKFITTVKDNNGWNEYIEAYNTILQGTSLCPKDNPDDIYYYIRPIENISDKGNRPTCEVICEKSNRLVSITAPGPGEAYWLTNKSITPPIYIMNRINTLSKTKKPKISKIGNSLLDLDITYSDDIDIPTNSSGVLF